MNRKADHHKHKTLNPATAVTHEPTLECLRIPTTQPTVNSQQPSSKKIGEVRGLGPKALGRVFPGQIESLVATTEYTTNITSISKFRAD